MPREDSASVAPKQKFGIPRREVTTPNPVDQVIVHENRISIDLWKALLPNTPHPDFPNALLVKETILSNDGNEIAYRRVYSTTQNAQEVYNGVTQFLEESSAHPIFIRNFVIRQADFVDKTRGTPCDAVVGLTINSGGTGYKDGDTITIDTQDGDTATGVIQVVNGVIVAASLTSGGSGYTSQPPVNITTVAGMGAAIMSQIQPQTAVLVNEKQEGLQDENLSPVFIRVIQVYKTEPGPVLTTKKYSEVGETLTVTDQERLSTDAPLPALSLTVLSAEVTPSDSVLSKVHTETRDAPASLVAADYDHERFGARVTTTIVDKLVADAILPTLDSTTIGGKITPINEVMSKTELTVVNAADKAWMYGIEFDPSTMLSIFTKKRFVHGTSAAAPGSPTAYGGAVKVITAASAAIPSVITSNGHGYSNGDIVFVQLQDSNPVQNGIFSTVASVTTNTFTAGFNLAGAATSGTVCRADAGTFLGDKYALIQSGDMTTSDVLEYQPYEIWSSIQIVSKIPALIGGNWTRVYKSAMQHAWPDELISAQFNWAYAINGNGSHIAIDIGLLADVKMGYRGDSPAIITEIVTFDTNSLSLPTIHRWHPHTFDIPANWGVALSGDGEAYARAVTFRIPDVIVAGGNYTIDYVGAIGGTPSGSPFASGTILTETDSAAPVAGTYYVLDIQTEKWRFGAFVVRIIQLTFPS